MGKVTAEEFNLEEVLVLSDNCRVNGKLYKAGDKVKVGGNDKMQLLASQKAQRQEVSAKEEKTQDKK